MKSTQHPRSVPALLVRAALIALLGAGTPGAVSAAPPKLRPTRPPAVAATWPVSLNANRMPVARALRRLFYQAGVNYSIGRGVRGRVTVHLHRVPFDRALDVVLAANRPRLTRTVRHGVYIIRAVRAPRRTSAGRARARVPRGTLRRPLRPRAGAGAAPGRAPAAP